MFGDGKLYHRFKVYVIIDEEPFIMASASTLEQAQQFQEELISQTKYDVEIEDSYYYLGGVEEK